MLRAENNAEPEGTAVDDLTAVPPPTMDDAALMLLLQQRSPAGLAQLYDRYGRLVYSLSVRIVQDPGTAEEITQDVFLRCWNNSERYQSAQGSLATWLLTITHHRAIDELRSRRSKAQRNEVSVDDLHYLASGDPALDDALLRDEVHKSLRSLPAAQREAIELIYWNGLSRREVADKLGVPLGTVHTRLRLGMEKLRGTFSRLFSDE